MKYYKFIICVSISFYSINSISDGLDQYKIELLIYKYKNVSTDESFNTNLSIPEQNLKIQLLLPQKFLCFLKIQLRNHEFHMHH